MLSNQTATIHLIIEKFLVCGGGMHYFLVKHIIIGSETGDSVPRALVSAKHFPQLICVIQQCDHTTSLKPLYNYTRTEYHYDMKIM